MARRLVAVLAFLAVSSMACYRQVVTTGRPAGAKVIDEPWLNSWFWGLVAPAPVDTRAECPSGVATVVTEVSWQNGIATLVTLGVYAPQHVTITCAAAGRAALRPGTSELAIPADADAAQRAEIVARAIALSAKQHAPVMLRF
ncbi:MAG TPA: hypothetical protein VIP11_21450 [Gemmatimonadaceae bacterium]